MPELSWQLVRFLAVGGLMTLANVVIYTALAYGLHLSPQWAAALAFLVLIPFHFASHARVTFRVETATAWTFVRYAGALAATLAFNVGLVTLCDRGLGLEPFWSQCVALGPTLLLNFALYRFVVFTDAERRDARP